MTDRSLTACTPPLKRTPLLVLVAGAWLVGRSMAQIEPNAVMLRTPDVSETQIAFRYADDLWLCPKTGGQARRITSGPGVEAFPRFSPDGRRVAFMGQYQGESDLYVLDLEAGIPERITFHPTAEFLCGFTPDGKSLIYHSTELSDLRRAPRLMSVPVAGGEPRPLPVPYGTFGAIDDTGDWVAYTPGSREFRTWKRYQGGMAQDIWLFNLRTLESRRLTDFVGTDAQPMWHGKDLIFSSDRGAGGVLNLWSMPVAGGNAEQLTFFNDFGVRFPAIGPKDVVFENGGQLYRLDLSTQQLEAVEVSIPGDRPALLPVYRELGGSVQSATVSPTAKRIVLEARGELFSVPVKEGITRNLTQSSAFAERSPSWSPDGSTLAYFSDEGGEMELWLMRLDGEPLAGADAKGRLRLTSHGAGYRTQLDWAPDSKKLCYASNDGGLWLLNLGEGSSSYDRIAVNPSGDPLEARWSKTSDWLCFSHRHSQSRLDAVLLYDLAQGFTHQVTSGQFDDAAPCFSPDGKYLYYSSARYFAPEYGDLDDTWIYSGMRQLVMVPLRKDVANPYAPEDDHEPSKEEAKQEAEEKAKEKAKQEGKQKADDAAADASKTQAETPAESESTSGAEPPAGAVDDADAKSLAIDLEGFEGRGIVLPVKHGVLGNLTATEGGLLYQRFAPRGEDEEGPGAGLLEYLEVGEDESSTVLAGVDGYQLVPDGKQLLVFTGGKPAIIQVAKDQKIEKSIDLSGVAGWFDPRQEWEQMLAETWRLFRDYFYDENMHGLDWAAIRERYFAALPDATSREDVSFLTGEMMAELNVGHSYNGRSSKDGPEAPKSHPAGLLGADLAVENGAHRLVRLLHGGEYDLDARSPLLEPGVDAKPGDYVLAVDGQPVDPGLPLSAALLGKAGREVELTLNSAPTLDGQERRVLVETLGDESEVRMRDWIRRSRERVDALSAGRIGYVYVPNTGIDGQNELMRQFLGAQDKDALLIDERWNGGGQIPTRFIELLNRPMTNFWALRHGEDWNWPPVGHRGPKAMLINGWAGSGGDAFPYYFRQAGLGKLYGERTWGGLVGISGNPALIDGTGHSIPRFAFYELDGTWGIEGYGVPPDVEVIADPTALAKGGDTQLEAAVAGLLKDLEAWPGLQKRRPAPPDRSGSGITDQDR